MLNQPLYDWQTLMVAVLRWLSGADPYQAYAVAGRQLPVGWFVYPPPALLLATPLALLPWQLSAVIMLLVSVVGFERWARRGSKRSGIAWLLLWLPLFQGLWIGQVTLLSLALLAMAQLAYEDQHDTWSGLLLAMALFKPQTLILPAIWMLIVAVQARRWRMLLTWVLISLLLWGGVMLISGPAIYQHWLDGLRSYNDNLPNRPLLFAPFGPAIAALALLFWWRAGRTDPWGMLLLLNTLIYPLSVIYVAVGVAFVVVRWRPDWPWYPLLLSWVLAIGMPMDQRTPDTIAALTQSIIATGLLAGLLPVLPIRRLPGRTRGQHTDYDHSDPAHKPPTAAPDRTQQLADD